MTRHPITALAAVSLALLALVAVGCGGDDDDDGASTGGGSDRFELTIASLLPFTGDLSAVSGPIDKAVELAVAETGEAAQAAGTEITVAKDSGDTEGDPQKAIQATRQVIDGGASCLIGPATTPEAQTMLTSVTRVRRVPMLPLAGGDAVTEFDDDDTVFRTVPPNRLQSVALYDAVEQALGDVSGKTISFAYQNSPYGEDFVNAFTEAVAADGGTLQGPIAYDPTQTSFDAEAERIVAGDPDAYAIIDYPDTFAKVGAALVRTGRFEADRLFVPTTLALPEIPEEIPAQALEGAHGERVGSPSDTPQAEAFDERYKAAGGDDRGALDSNAFDAAVLCFLAATAAGSADPEQIAAQLPEVAGGPGRKVTFLELADAVTALRAGEEIDYEGVSGPIDFDEHGDPTTQLFDFYTYRDGELTVDRQEEVGG